MELLVLRSATLWIDMNRESMRTNYNVKAVFLRRKNN